MAYQLATEIQHMIWTYSMYNSAKVLEFRIHIHEEWFKRRLRRLSYAFMTKSQDIYHQELGQLLLSMDEVLNIFLENAFKISYRDIQDTLFQISQE